jgi:hypothetical protein
MVINGSFLKINNLLSILYETRFYNYNHSALPLYIDFNYFGFAARKSQSGKIDFVGFGFIVPSRAGHVALSFIRTGIS